MYLFVHKLLVMGLKHTEPELLKATHYPCWVGKLIPKPHVIFLLPCYSICEAARVRIGCNSGSNKIPFRFEFV